MSNAETTAPKISGVPDAIVMLERRCDTLEERVATRKKSGLAVSWDEKELKAIQKGILALRLHRDEVEDEDRATLALEAVLTLLEQIQHEVTLRPEMRQELGDHTLRIRTLVGNIGD